MTACHWCATLQEAHKEHAVAKGYFDVVFATAEAQEHARMLKQANQRLRQDLAIAQDDVLLEARNLWGVYRREWASVLDQEWYRLRERLKAAGILLSAEPPWQSAVERIRRERRIQQEDGSRKALIPRRQATADRFQGEI